MQLLKDKTALVTGGAHRLGAAIVRTLHGEGMNVTVHYNSAESWAQELRAELETERPGSVELIHADLAAPGEAERIVDATVNRWNGLDALVNNASTFSLTRVGEVTRERWQSMVGVNLEAPFFLCQAAAPHLIKTDGNVVNIADIYGDRPLKGFSVYSITKAGIIMLTKSLARELGPRVRVNAISPGPILWPADRMAQERKDKIISRTALKRRGDPSDIARAVLFLLRDAGYVTGHVLNVDGGRSLR